MTNPKIDASFYATDTHHGDRENLIRDRQTEKLQELVDYYNLKINNVVLTGDVTEKWMHHEELWDNDEEEMKEKYTVPQHRKLYDALIKPGEESNVEALAGNHEIEVVGEGPKTYVERAQKANKEAVENLHDIIRNKTLFDRPEINVNVQTGIKEVEEGVIVNHGDYIEGKNALKKVLDSFDETMTREEKIDLINNNPEIYGEMQEVWQKRNREKLWPVIKGEGIVGKILKKVTQGNYSEALFVPFQNINDYKGFMNTVKKSRSFREFMSNMNESNIDSILFQVELLKAIEEKEKQVMVSGHLHLKGTHKTGKNLSISLGNWDNERRVPNAAIHVAPTDDNPRDRWVIVEFDKNRDEWVPIKEFEWNEDNQEWEEDFGTTLTTINEIDENMSDEEWNALNEGLNLKKMEDEVKKKKNEDRLFSFNEDESKMFFNTTQGELMRDQ